MSLLHSIRRPPWRTVVPLCTLALLLGLGYVLWAPGLDIRDGRHDCGHNAIWLSHGWLGADEWFIQNGKTNQLAAYRDVVKIRELADKLRRHHITDLFPHLCPAEPDGRLPAVDPLQVERFLDQFNGFRVFPWVGGPNAASVRLNSQAWRKAFTNHVAALLKAHPRFAGIHLNVEPLPSGDTNFLALLDELRSALPQGKLLSIAAYPPPTRWQPNPEVHWDRAYYGEIARRCDQLAVMMYDVGQRIPKTYQRLMVDWTQEILPWSGDKAVLLGLPTYDDIGVEYHHANVENLTNALLGVHRGLSRQALPTNYQGIAIYCDWETSEEEWGYFREHFMMP